MAQGDQQSYLPTEVMKQQDAPSANREIPKGPSLRSTLLEEAFARSTPTNMDAMRGGSIFKSKRVTFTIPREMCKFDFGEDFELTLEETDAAAELDAARDSQTGTEINMKLARASMHGLNGAPIDSIKRGWLWEALGTGGRMLVVYAFQTHLQPRGDEEGKAMLQRIALSSRVE